MRSKVFFKLLAGFVLVIATTALILDIAVRREWDSSLRAQITQSLIEKTQMFAARVEHAEQLPAARVVSEVATASHARATLIDSSGKVLADSEADPAHMENHAGRPEFASALSGHVGTSTRSSKTVGIDYLYVAVPVSGGAVRLAYPLSSIEQSTATIRNQLLQASVLALFIATLIAGFLSHLVSRRLQKILVFAERVASGDLSARISESSSDEIAQVAAALDVTARKLETSFATLQMSKEQLETLLNSIPNAVMAVSADLRIQWANGAMQSLEPQIRIGAPVVETFRNPDLLQAFAAAIRETKMQSIHTDNLISGRTFNVTATPMPGGGAVAVLQDVTEIERVEKTRRDFIANVSHELRTPLTSIQGYVETVLDSYPKNADGRQFLEIIQKHSARMSRLTEDLLVLARVESGEEKPALEKVSARELISEAEESLSSIAHARGVSLKVTATSDSRVMADKYAIQQVFANLIDNAVKYSTSGNEVQIAAQEMGDAVEFSVRDFGPGISFEHQPRLFERFYRVDASRSRDSGGTGLGLAIVKHIVRNHGGKVWVESALNHGATFFFTLPVSRN